MTCENHEVPAAADERFLSPSLLGSTRTTAAFEMKFLLRPRVAEMVTAWARDHLEADPHVDLAGVYRIRSLYFDTPGLDVFHRSAGYKRRKFRLRRYGAENHVHLERKTKSGDRVSKKRLRIPEHEVGCLEAAQIDPGWPGYWFARHLRARGLEPRCFISYERQAFVGTSDAGPLRLTMDCDLHCGLTSGYSFENTRGALPLLTDQVVLELKYAVALPTMFKRLIEEMGLAPASVSKYRLGVQAWGLETMAKGVG